MLGIVSDFWDAPVQLILGGVNGRYLRNITEKAARGTDEVLAAVAYATDAALLFDWCWEHRIPLRFYGRLDDNVAISVPVLESFLRRKSPSFVCRLVQHHHAKVIWWRGIGLYIGSANLTGSAWYRNVEAGCFFPSDEISDEMAGEMHALFDALDQHSTPLTEELFKEMKWRAQQIARPKSDANEFWRHPSLITWPGLGQTDPKRAGEKRRQDWLREWYATLQDLRAIGEEVSRTENRPAWVNAGVPAGSQADQFLHAFYTARTFDGRKANYEFHFQKNKGRKSAALAEAMVWWRSLPEAPNLEDQMLNVVAPKLQSLLAEPQIGIMTWADFREICISVHAIKDYARRVRNKAVNLPDDGRSYTVPQKVDALSNRIWNDQGSNGERVTELLRHVLYGSTGELPERLWQAVSDSRWKVDGLGVSALGELVGWALPDEFPPRNGRTSKALRALGYDVTVHVE